MLKTSLGFVSAKRGNPHYSSRGQLREDHGPGGRQATRHSRTPPASVLCPAKHTETRRAQVYGKDTEIINEGEVNSIYARLPRPLLLLISACLNHYYVAQVESSADGTKITNTGTNLADGPVEIFARPPRPSASEGLDASLARRSLRLRPKSR